jgi:hypothetical protein
MSIENRSFNIQNILVLLVQIKISCELNLFDLLSLSISMAFSSDLILGFFEHSFSNVLIKNKFQKIENITDDL